LGGSHRGSSAGDPYTQGGGLPFPALHGAALYLRLFVEPHVEGLSYQRRNQTFLVILKPNVSSSRGFAVAYLWVTIAFGLAWVMAPIERHTGREWWQWSIVAFFVLLSLSQVLTLYSRSRRGWPTVEEAWKKADKEWKGAFDAESQGRTRHARRSHLMRNLVTVVSLLWVARRHPTSRGGGATARIIAGSAAVQAEKAILDAVRP
jgi:hypothetical protein